MFPKLKALWHEWRLSKESASLNAFGLFKRDVSGALKDTIKHYSPKHGYKMTITMWSSNVDELVHLFDEVCAYMETDNGKLKRLSKCSYQEEMPFDEWLRTTSNYRVRLSDAVDALTTRINRFELAIDRYLQSNSGVPREAIERRFKPLIEDIRNLNKAMLDYSLMEQ